MSKLQIDEDGGLSLQVGDPREKQGFTTWAFTKVLTLQCYVFCGLCFLLVLPFFALAILPRKLRPSCVVAIVRELLSPVEFWVETIDRINCDY